MISKVYTKEEVIGLQPKIESIIFDFGGVLLDLYPQRSIEELYKVLNLHFDPADEHASINRPFIDLEVGSITMEKFLWELQRMSNTIKTPHPKPIIDAWNAMLGGWQKEKLTFLNEVKVKLPIYLLSNTNEIHLDWVRRDLQKHHGIGDFDAFFCKAYYSHLIGMRKPHEEIYKYVIKDADIEKATTLFIDDNPQNVKAAANVGIPSLLHDRNTELDWLLDLV